MITLTTNALTTTPHRAYQTASGEYWIQAGDFIGRPAGRGRKFVNKPATNYADAVLQLWPVANSSFYRGGGEGLEDVTIGRLRPFRDWFAEQESEPELVAAFDLPFEERSDRHQFLELLHRAVKGHRSPRSDFVTDADQVTSLGRSYIEDRLEGRQQISGIDLMAVEVCIG